MEEKEKSMMGNIYYLDLCKFDKKKIKVNRKILKQYYLYKNRKK